MDDQILNDEATNPSINSDDVLDSDGDSLESDPDLLEDSVLDEDLEAWN
jgi:hypothetical protein